MNNSVKPYFLALMITLIAFSNNSFAQQKIAYVEADSIIYQMPEYKNIDIQSIDYNTPSTAKLRSKQLEFQQLYNNIIDTLNNFLVTPVHQEKMKKRLAKKQEELEQLTLQVSTEILQKEEDLFREVNKKFDKALAEVAKENGYDYIIDKKDILYINDGIDATDKVKIKLGL